MDKLICRASLLKNHDGRLKRAPFGSKMCILCQIHMVTQCQFHQAERESMLLAINDIADIEGQEVFNVVMGKYIEGWYFEEMLPIWQITCTSISNMYKNVLRFHKKTYNLAT